MGNTRWRLDTNRLSEQATLWAQRELESVRTETYLKKLSPLSASEWIPQDTDEAKDSEYIVHQMYELLGLAQAIQDAADDLPLANVNKTEVRYEVQDYGCAYKHTYKEIERARRLQMSLDQKRAEAARRATNYRLNQVAWFGDLTVNVPGAINNPNVPRTRLAAPIDSNTNAGTIVDMLNALPNNIFNETKQNARPDTMLMATPAYTHIMSTDKDPSSANDTTILQYILGENTLLETVEPVDELVGAGPNGENLVFCYNSANETMQHKLVRSFEQMPPQERNLAVITNCVAASAGTPYNYPLEAVVAEIPKS